MEELVVKETMSSIEIAELTDKRHDSVLRDIRVLLSQGVSAHNFVESEYKNARGKIYPMYSLTKKGCLILASGYNAVLREKIINRWEELETKERQNQIVLPNFNNPAEAARAWAAEYEAKQLAQLEAKQANEHIQRLVHDAKTYTSSELAKELGIKSAIAFNRILETKKVQFKQNGTWLLYSNYAEKGYVSIKQIQLDNGHIQYDRRWTGKGRDFILDLFKGD